MSAHLFVISGPSGSGKSTISARLLQRAENLKLSVSATTRAPRDKEEHGQHYFFLTHERFEDMIKQDAFYEYAKVFNNYYGTPVKPVREELSRGRDVLLEIDVQGAMQIKSKEPSAVLIFIMPPSVEELEKRLSERNSETAEQLKTRLGKAKEEMSYAVNYDYVLINDDLDKCVDMIYEIYKDCSDNA